jgi:hypothetical protein
VVFIDENGEDIALHIVDYFLYNGDEYVILTDSETDDWDEETDEEAACCCEEHDHSDEDEEPEEVDVYVMRVEVIDDENEEFVPLDPDKEEEVLAYAEKFLNGDLPEEDY